MVATDTAILPWHRPSLAGAPPQTALNKPEAPDGPDNSETSGGFHPFGDDGFSFFDLIDVVNPLQHIPVIGTLYRELTGDDLGPLPRIAGSTLFFGPAGAAFSTADVVLEEVSGQDVGDHVMALLRDGDPLSRTVADSAPVPDTSQAVSVVASKPAAAGTDGELPGGELPGGEDPISAWARAELAYRSSLATQQASIAPQPSPQQIPRAAETAHAVAGPIPASEQADASWANAPLVAAAAAAPAPAPVQSQASRGAVAPQGGWFAANMMHAIERYHHQKALSESDRRPEAGVVVN